MPKISVEKPLSGSSGSGGRGNTRASPRLWWTFTFNNFSEEALKWFQGVDGSGVLSTLVFQVEVGKKGTPHLQGFCRFKKKIRVPSAKIATSLETDELKEEFASIHWERMKGTVDDNLNYCTKSKTRVDGPWFVGIEPPEVLECLEEEELYEWQREIVDLCKTKPDKRTIHWYWEPEGNFGKSELVRYLTIKHGAIMVDGKAADMKYGIAKYKEKHKRGPKIVIFDIPRSRMDTEEKRSNISYNGMEQIKNANFYSTKYESGMVTFNRPHLLVFANYPPDLTNMSMDRWHVVRLEGAAPPQPPPPLKEIDSDDSDAWRLYD